MGKAALFALVVSFAAAGPALAQDSGAREFSITGFIAPGFTTDVTEATLRFGAILEKTSAAGGFGWAIEISHLTAPTQDFDTELTMVSPGLLYTFGGAESVRPYLRFGPAILVSRYGAAPFMGHAGGGVNYWIKQDLGLKAEGRYSFVLWDPRAGIVDLIVGVTYRF